MKDVIERIVVNRAGRFGIIRVRSTCDWHPFNNMRVVVRQGDVGEFTLTISQLLFGVPGVWVGQMEFATRLQNSKGIYDFRSDEECSFEILQ